MKDTPAPQEPAGNDAPRMTLLAINQTYWLYEGVDLLNDMLFARGSYPFKVRCLIFKDIFELKKYVAEGVVIGSLWGINPDIVERLRRDKHLIEVFPN